MNLSRTYDLLQYVLFISTCVAGLIFVVTDIHWFYVLDNNAKWNALFTHYNEYEILWYLDVFTYIFLYLWLAVKLLRFACDPAAVKEVFEKYLVTVFRYVYPCLTFDTLFKVSVLVVAFLILRHAFGCGSGFTRLVILSDIRPMANIWYDIYCPLNWLFRIIWS